MRQRAILGGMFVALAVLLISGCKKKAPDPPSEIERRSCDTANGVVTADRVIVDEQVFTEGKASLRIASGEMPMTVNLYSIGYPGVENADLVYKAKIRTKDLLGQACLQLTVQFPNGGEVSKQVEAKAAPGDTTEWRECQISLPIASGQRPSKVGLGLIMDSMGGTAWIDDIRLIKVPK